jgi:hypothetical protein
MMGSKNESIGFVTILCLLLVAGTSIALEDLIPREELLSTEIPALPEDLILQYDIETGSLSLHQDTYGWYKRVHSPIQPLRRVW